MKIVLAFLLCFPAIVLADNEISIRHSPIESRGLAKEIGKLSVEIPSDDASVEPLHFIIYTDEKTFQTLSSLEVFSAHKPCTLDATSIDNVWSLKKIGCMPDERFSKLEQIFIPEAIHLTPAMRDAVEAELKKANSPGNELK